MKKILLTGVSLVSLAISGSAMAAANLGDFTEDNTKASQTSVKPADCELLNADIKINSSAGNVGSWSCDTTTANIGVAFGNVAGKGNIYSASSAGGSVTGAPTAAGAAPTAGMTATAAATASAES